MLLRRAVADAFMAVLSILRAVQFNHDGTRLKKMSLIVAFCKQDTCSTTNIQTT